MELKELPGIVVLMVVVAMLLAIGVLVVSNLGDAAKETASISDEQITWAYETNVSLAQGNVTGIGELVNGTTGIGTVCTTNYTLYGEGILKGVSLLYARANSSACKDGGLVNISYSYNDYDTPTYDVTQNTISAVAPIATTWMGLMITIIILSIILVLVIKSFAKTR